MCVYTTFCLCIQTLGLLSTSWLCEKFCELECAEISWKPCDEFFWMCTQKWDWWWYHMVVLFLIFWRTAILFSIVVAPFCIPTKQLFFSFFFTSSCPNEYEVFICISLTISDIEHLFVCLLVILYIFGEMSVQVLCLFLIRL